MGKPPLLPRLTLHLIAAFTFISIVMILLFPTLSYTKSVYRDDGFVPDGFRDDDDATVSLKMKRRQQPADIYFQGNGADGTVIELSSNESAFSMMTFMVIWILEYMWFVILLCWQSVTTAIQLLQHIAGYVLDKFLSFLQPFIVMTFGFYTVTFVWPTQVVTFVTETFYPLVILLACASLIGLITGGLASFTTHLKNLVFPPGRNYMPRPHTVLGHLHTVDGSRPATPPDSVLSSGTITPFNPRAPPPSKYPSGANLEDIHILDTNALFTSFALPAPPQTPPGILFSAPTPVGSLSGVVGDTIFEEEEPVGVESWAVGGGKPLSRAESAHGRVVGVPRGRGKGTWHGKARREDIAVVGMDWGDGIRRRV
jgi:hypothetical protein